jgi:AraC-like DNA-binding protein
MAARERGKGSAQHWLAGTYALQLVRLVARWHISPAELLKGLDISELALSAPGATIPLETVIAVWERARTLTGEPGLGFHVGLSQRVTGHGYVGFAAMTAESYGRTLDLAIRYAPLMTTMMSLRLEVQGDLASLIVDEHSDPKSVRDMLLIALLVGLRQVGSDITAAGLRASIDLSIPEPDYYKRFAKLVPGVRFGQPVNRMVFEASGLALPLSMADPEALRLASEQCERALEALGPEAMLVARVRRALVDREGFRSLRQVAAELRLSPRTLMRLLAEQRTSFVDLVDQERQRKAQRLLSSSHLNLALEDVAAQLGYSTASNFVRAFHRWTGQTPAAYRRSMREPHPPASLQTAARRGGADGS